ncbi:O-methyltransferase MdmC-like isoform X1 [Salvia divinorum]|uniref:O-methyltransferase MdmC-like isoform X1 n=1 Tax=Salvia divinorum TaxID=28513 RepID=A0ABD1FN74_SALDI
MSSGLGFVHQCLNPLIAFRSPGHSFPLQLSARGLIVSRPIGWCRVEVLKSVPNPDTVVAADESYGRKEVISVNPRLYDYLLVNVREHKILCELREETATRHGSQMQVSPDQAQLLAMLVQIMGAKKCIEVGVYTGYSSLAVALVLPEGGQLVACEREAKSLEVAQRY